VADAVLRLEAEARLRCRDYPEIVRSPLRLLPPWLREVAFALGLCAVAAVAVLARHGDARLHGAWIGSLAPAVLAVAVLILRRRNPLGVLAVVCAIALAAPNSASVILPVLLATFNVALRCGRREVAIAASSALAALIVAAALHDGLPNNAFQKILSLFVAVGLAVAAGLYFSARRAYVGSLQDRAGQLERERLLLADQAVAAERVRIARELHDVVAHGVSLMVVQAQALGALEGGARDLAGAQIATIGREALTEMHRMLDVLRPQGDEVAELAPAPGVRDVPGLVERARGAGIDVELAVEGQPRPLPAGVDLSAYRIVQEALTNVVKHARALRTEVRLRYAADALELSVLDDGTSREDGPPGHGLVGMRERVALFGGTLEAGRRVDAPGYAVRAVLPL
jgi:signal transduction histidine kinase